MVKIQEISIVASFIGLWAHPYLPDQYELFFGFFLIFTFGLLHGANDLLIIHRFPSYNKKVWYRKLTIYVLSILSVAIFLLPISCHWTSRFSGLQRLSFWRTAFASEL